MQMYDTTLVFVDGENLSIRYKEMLAAGHIPCEQTSHLSDCFVWNQKVLDDHVWDIKRLSYYTSVVGDDDKVRSVRNVISSTVYRCLIDSDDKRKIHRSGQIVPFVKKKSSKVRKESVCDISIAVDVMRACYRDHAENIWLFSGDGDFANLIEEAVHSGKRVYLSAFSSGLSDELKLMVDEFIPLDKYFFVEKTNEVEINLKRLSSENNVPEKNVRSKIAQTKSKRSSGS